MLSFLYPRLHSCFHVLAPWNNAAVKMGGGGSLRDLEFSSLGCTPRTGMSGSRDGSRFNVLEAAQYCFPQILYHSVFAQPGIRFAFKVS